MFPASPPVEFDPDGGEHAPGVVDGHSVDVVRQDRDGQHHGHQGGDVPEASVGLLQVGLEQEADIPIGAVAFGDQVAQHLEPGGLLSCPPFTGTLEHRHGHLRIAADHPAVKEAEGHSEILAG